MLTSNYQFHHAPDARVAELDRAEAAVHRRSAFRTAAAVVAANVAGFALLIWLAF